MTKPIQSMRLAVGSLESCTLARVMTMATTPMGRLTKKIQRQPMPLVMAPADQRADGHGAAERPRRRPRRRSPAPCPEKAWAIRASDVANMMAPPTPWTARARLSISGVVDSPQAREDSGEDDQTDGVDAAPTEHVADHAGGEQEGGQGEGVGVDHPLEIGEGGVRATAGCRAGPR